MRRSFQQFSFPGGVPSHCAPETPGSFDEGGELGYSLLHAFGAVLDNPDLVAFCVVGDGEAETGPLATSWHVGKLLNPASDGAVVPVLHRNGFKIANPTVLARIPDDDLTSLLRGYGYDPLVVSGDDPAAVHQQLAGAVDSVIGRIGGIQRAARSGEHEQRPVRWPMVVLRTPKGWTGPIEVAGQQVEGGQDASDDRVQPTVEVTPPAGSGEPVTISRRVSTGSLGRRSAVSSPLASWTVSVSCV